MIFNNTELYHKIVASQGKLMAIDVGTKRLGIADCDFSRILVTPRMIIDRKSEAVDFAKIADFALENEIKAIIIGFPTHMDGKRVEMTDFVEKFAKRLDIFLNEGVFAEKDMAILFFDERLSSFEAEMTAREIPRRKKHKHHDDIAASVILQGFLDDIRGC